MSDYHAVLVYDGECPLCSAAATALRRVGAVGAIEWEDDPAQAFLAAQFGETPFALVFADSREERVYVGREAARELCERAGMPVL
jgi:predicted DCC family thiol-disulfide oxidoreductase YuxK